MKNVAGVFLDYFRLERKRVGPGLTVQELERWSLLKSRLDDQMLSEAASKRREHRRASVRIPTHLHCSFACRSDFDDAVITNLSAGGVFISTTTPLPIGSELKLDIHVANTGSSIEVEGVVVSNNVRGDLAPSVAGMGVRFSRVGASTIDAIHDLYERELEREAAEPKGDPRSIDAGGARLGGPVSAGSNR